MSIFILILIFLIFFIFLWLSLAILKGTFFGAPWVPVDKKTLAYLIGLLDLKENEILYDLGSGDGRVLIEAAAKYNFKKAVGIEVSGFLCLWSKIKIRLKGLSSKIIIKKANLFKENLAEADVIIFYLMPECLKKVKEKFKKELKSGTRIFSVSFPLPDRQPSQIFKKQDTLTVYYYEISV